MAKAEEKLHLGDDAEITLPDTSSSKDEPYSLDQLMEDSDIVEHGSTFEGLTDWKLDQRIAEIAADPNADKFQSLHKLVELISTYEDELTILDQAEHELQSAERVRDVFEILSVLPSAIVLLTVFLEVVYDQLRTFDALIAIAVPLLNLYLYRLKEVDFKIGSLRVHEKLWVKLHRAETASANSSAQAEETYEQIRGYFGELGLKWYLRENVFTDALEHIVDVYESSNLKD